MLEIFVGWVIIAFVLGPAVARCMSLNRTSEEE